MYGCSRFVGQQNSRTNSRQSCPMWYRSSFSQCAASCGLGMVLEVQDCLVVWPKTAQLIEAFRQFPCLWDVKNSSYKDRNLKWDALSKIPDIMQEHLRNVTIDQINKKWGILRGQHRRELKRNKGSTKSGAGTEDVHKPKLWCFAAMSFLIGTTDSSICFKPTRRSTQSLNQACIL